MRFFVGTAGWTVPRQHAALFDAGADKNRSSHLQRYASRLRCVEINSSFHRPHRRGTWERWAATTPAGFRFAVKLPKAITHIARLEKPGRPLQEFLNAATGLGEKLGPVLVQLPPKLAFDEALAEEFFTTLRELHRGSVVLEPRNASWFTGPVDRLLRSFEIARAAADPPRGAVTAALPGGWPHLQYWRLHGTPQTYTSNYEEPALLSLAEKLQALAKSAPAAETWVVFDNTARGHATANAVWLHERLQKPAGGDLPLRG